MFDTIKKALTEVLDGQEAMHCTRVWEAWSYGTMSEDDFRLVTEDEDALDEIVRAVLSAMAPLTIEFGLHQSNNGETVDLGGFEGYLTEEEEEN